MERFARLLRGGLIELDVMPEIADRPPKGRSVKRVVGAGIDDESNGRAFPLLSGNSQIVLSGSQLATGLGTVRPAERGMPGGLGGCCERNPVTPFQVPDLL